MDKYIKNSPISNKKELWTDKYKPDNIEDMIGNKKNIEIIKQWLSDFKNGKDVQRALFIYGSPGIGKTTFAHLILKHFNFEVIEFNASDVRSQKSVREELTKILNNNNISYMKNNIKRNIGIIMDEVDGMSSGDKGGVTELVSIIDYPKKSDKKKIYTKYVNPIICICNNNTEKKLSDLKKICLEIKFLKPTENDLQIMCNKIIDNENINIEDDALQLIIKYSQLDVRRLLYLLQDVKKTMEDKVIKTEDVENICNFFSKKKIDFSISESTNKLLNNYDNIENIMLLYESDKSLMGMMLHENIINNIQNSRKDNNKIKLKKMYEIIHNLSIGDIIDKYIYNHQLWNLQNYNGFIKCCLPSQILNSMQKKISSRNDIVFTSLLSKSALQYANQNNFTMIKNKFQINRKYVMYANEIILDQVFSDNEENIKEGIYKLINYDLDISYLDKIVKLNKIEKENKFKKKYTIKNKNKFTKIFNSLK